MDDQNTLPPSLPGIQILAPICRFCQHPLPAGGIVEVAVTEVLHTTPKQLTQLTTSSITWCQLCNVGHRVYLATSLNESRCVTVPCEAVSVEEAGKFNKNGGVGIDDVLGAVDMMVGDGFSNMLSLWAKGKMGAPKKASRSRGSRKRKDTRRGGPTTGRPAL